MLKVAFGKQNVGRTQVFEWLSKFEVSVASVEETECLGVYWWAKRENVDWVMTVALENRWVAICEVAKMLCISLGLVFWKTVWTCIGLLPNSCSAPAHSALSLCEFLAKSIMSVVPHPPFWVDLVPYCFTLFSDLNIVIREGDWMMLSWFWQNNGMHFLNFKLYLLKCFEWWHNSWVCYIKPHGDYFEGDSIDQEVNVFMEIEIQYGNFVITSHKLFLCCCEYDCRITVEVLSWRFVWMTFLYQTWGKQILLKRRYLSFCMA